MPPTGQIADDGVDGGQRLLAAASNALVGLGTASQATAHRVLAGRAAEDDVAVGRQRQKTALVVRVACAEERARFDEMSCALIG